MSELDIADATSQDGRFNYTFGAAHEIIFPRILMPKRIRFSVVIRILAKDEMTAGHHGGLWDRVCS